MRAIGLLLAISFLAVVPTRAQQSDAWTIVTSDGSPADIDAVAKRASEVDVVLVGELHDDTLGHQFKAELLRALHEDAGRAVALSLEMFESDVQLVVDEYLAGMISEAHFRASSRPWQNYERDYRPMVEFAREHGLAVVAANPPRRYVNAVSRGGLTALDSLFSASRYFLPPLPLPHRSELYQDTFLKRIEGMPAHGPSPANLLDAQHLWDAGMAYFIARKLDRSPGILIMHAAGAFHVESGIGIESMLEAYRPATSTLVVAVRPADAFHPEQHAGLGDFVVVTHHP